MEINDSDGEIGLVSGEKCNRDGCNGIMHEIDDDSSCSCHICPPCSHCVDVRFQCDECGYETETPSYSEINSKEASTIGIPDYFRWKSTEEKFNELKDNEFGYVTICGKYYWMEAKGKYPEGMTTEEILSKFNTCFGYKWLKAPCNGQFHLKYYTD